MDNKESWRSRIFLQLFVEMFSSVLCHRLSLQLYL